MPPKAKPDSAGYQKLKQDLSKGEPGRLYVFHGEETYLRDHYLGRLKERILTGGMGTFNLHELSARDMSPHALEEAVDCLPMMGERTLVLVTDFDLFKAGEKDREAYIRLLIEEMMPAVVQSGLAEFCDVFCETGVFTAGEAERILKAAQAAGLGAKCHCDEIGAIGGTEMAGRLGAVSCEHLIVTQPQGVAALAAGGTIACCLPATSFYLDAAYAPARAMIEAGVPVAFGSDFNPGSCPVHSLQTAMNIGCYKYRMTPEECLTAVTLNAAAAVGRSRQVGTLEAGKQADILVWEAANLDYIFYRFGDNLVGQVFKAGRLVAGC